MKYYNGVKSKGTMNKVDGNPKETRGENMAEYESGSCKQLND